MKVALDLDGVVCDWLTPYLDKYNKDMGTDITPADLREDKEWPLQKEWCDENFFKLNHLIKPFDGAVEFVKELTRRYQVIVVTARAPMCEIDTINFCYDYFDNSYCPGISGVFLKKEKGEFAKNIGITVAIDDSIKNYDDYMAKGIPCLIFERPYNKWLRDGLDYVDSYEQILRRLRLTWG